MRPRQLEHSYELALLFEQGYGYRSGLNGTMRDHLGSVVQDLLERFPLKQGDTVMDIGANDGTLLAALPDYLRKIAVDPGIPQYKSSYNDVRGLYVALIPGYFPEVLGPCDRHQAKLITSIAMFYDVGNPLRFMQHIREMLARSGIWYVEQFYLGTMLQDLVYGTICHEHACYYGVKVLYDLSRKAGLKIIDVSFNPSNGGSVGLVLARSDSSYEESKSLDFVLAREERVCSQLSLDSFGKRVLDHAAKFHKLLTELTKMGNRIFGVGASTTMNPVLQLSRVSYQIKAIGEINEDKFGKVTPGTRIPIIPQDEMMKMDPDFLVIFPWHFRAGFIEQFQSFIEGGGKLIFPFPKLEVYPQ